MKCSLFQGCTQRKSGGRSARKCVASAISRDEACDGDGGLVEDGRHSTWLPGCNCHSLGIVHQSSFPDTARKKRDSELSRSLCGGALVVCENGASLVYVWGDVVDEMQQRGDADALGGRGGLDPHRDTGRRRSVTHSRKSVGGEVAVHGDELGGGEETAERCIERGGSQHVLCDAGGVDSNMKVSLRILHGDERCCVVVGAPRDVVCIHTDLFERGQEVRR
mmetsp:Transcript_51501/g.120839  ORF Transcript_51501/g.120839 Transcript_51501/m.120839 type:complete len:221 (+) Transcript_51501:105-767(+)